MCWGGSVVVMDFFLTGVVFFYKLTRNLYLTIFYFFFSWGGGARGGVKGGGRIVYVHEQMFQTAILLFKENTCAKSF